MARVMLREIDSYIFVSLIICINQKKKKSVTQKQTVALISVVEKNMDKNHASQCSA